MKTFNCTHRVHALLAIIAGMAVCVSASAGDYSGTGATHSEQALITPVPSGSFTAWDDNVTVTVRFVPEDAIDNLVKSKPCWQLDVLVQSKSTEPITAMTNDESVDGRKVTAYCNPELLQPAKSGILGSMKTFVTGGIAREDRRVVAIANSFLTDRTLQEPGSTRANDYVPKDRTYRGLYFTYKKGGVEYGFPISFDTPVSVATTGTPQ